MPFLSAFCRIDSDVDSVPQAVPNWNMANNQIVLCTSCRNYVSNIINIPPSPTPHLHRTQLAPDISESILIGESVSHARTTVSQLDAEIEKMSATLNELRNKRDGLHRFVLEH